MWKDFILVLMKTIIGLIVYRIDNKSEPITIDSIIKVRDLIYMKLEK